MRIDVSDLTKNSLGRVLVALLEVDLCRPTLPALEVTYNALEDGGHVFVDEVWAGSAYDGAAQAYLEFTDKIKHQPHYVGDRCGVIRKLLAPSA